MTETTQWQERFYGACRSRGLSATDGTIVGDINAACPLCAAKLILEEPEVSCSEAACGFTARGEPWEVASAMEKAKPAVAAAEGASQALPALLSMRDFGARPTVRPPELIAGLLFRGTKMIVGGPSKARKSWSLIDMGLSVACGGTWWGLPTREGRVCYLNFELQDWMLTERLAKITDAKRFNPRSRELIDVNFHIWNLRGHNAPAEELVDLLAARLTAGKFDLIILDPVYKALGAADENSATDIARLMDNLERLCRETGAAVVLAHHFAKGESNAKHAVDRMSGSGVWARDPDSVLVLTPPPKDHAERDDGKPVFTVESALRAHRPLPPFRIVWEGAIFAQDTAAEPVRPALSGPKPYSPRAGSSAGKFGSFLLVMPPLSHSRTDKSEVAEWLAAKARIGYQEALGGFRTIQNTPGQQYISMVDGKWQGNDYGKKVYSMP